MSTMYWCIGKNYILVTFYAINTIIEVILKLNVQKCLVYQKYYTQFRSIGNQQLCDIAVFTQNSKVPIIIILMARKGDSDIMNQIEIINYKHTLIQFRN